MPFDPKAYLSTKSAGSGFDPKAYLASKQQAQAPQENPNQVANNIDTKQEGPSALQKAQFDDMQRQAAIGDRFASTFGSAAKGLIKGATAGLGDIDPHGLPESKQAEYAGDAFGGVLLGKGLSSVAQPLARGAGYIMEKSLTPKDTLRGIAGWLRGVGKVVPSATTGARVIESGAPSGRALAGLPGGAAEVGIPEAIAESTGPLEMGSVPARAPRSYARPTEPIQPEMSVELEPAPPRAPRSAPRQQEPAIPEDLLRVANDQYSISGKDMPITPADVANPPPIIDALRALLKGVPKKPALEAKPPRAKLDPFTKKRY